MDYSIRFSSRATWEVKAAAEWYDEQLPDLGERFTMALIAKIDGIAKRPGSYGVYSGTLRKAIWKEYPFIILFMLHKRKKEILIQSVFHTRRHPCRRPKA